MADLVGMAMGVGSGVTSDYKGTFGNDADYGLSVVLSEDVIPGVTTSMLVIGWDEDMAAAVDQDCKTIVDDASGEEENKYGCDAGVALEYHADRIDYERMTELLEMVTEIIEELDAREVLSPQPLEER